MGWLTWDSHREVKLDKDGKASPWIWQKEAIDFCQTSVSGEVRRQPDGCGLRMRGRQRSENKVWGCLFSSWAPVWRKENPWRRKGRLGWRESCLKVGDFGGIISRKEGQEGAGMGIKDRKTGKSVEQSFERDGKELSTGEGRGRRWAKIQRHSEVEKSWPFTWRQSSVGRRAVGNVWVWEGANMFLRGWRSKGARAGQEDLGATAWACWLHPREVTAQCCACPSRKEAGQWGRRTGQGNLGSPD